MLPAVAALNVATDGHVPCCVSEGTEDRHQLSSLPALIGVVICPEGQRHAGRSLVELHVDGSLRMDRQGWLRQRGCVIRQPRSRLLQPQLVRLGASHARQKMEPACR